MREPNALIGTEELAAALGQPDLRIYDCTTYLDPAPPGSDDPYLVVPGRRTFEEAHIPGADFLDLQGEFSDQATRLRFMMAPTAQLEAAFSRHGLVRGTRVVLYSIGTMMWATRFWWMLKSLGFEDAAVLNGGFDAWKAEGRPTESALARGYPPGVSAPRRALDSLSTSSTCWRRRKRAIARSSTPSDRNFTKVSNRAAMAGRDGFPAASMCQRRPSSMKRKNSSRLPTRKPRSTLREWTRTSA